MILTDKNMSDYFVAKTSKMERERQKNMEKLNNLLHNTLGKKEYLLIVENKPVIASEPEPAPVKSLKVESVKKPEAKKVEQPKVLKWQAKDHEPDIYFKIGDIVKPKESLGKNFSFLESGIVTDIKVVKYPHKYREQKYYDIVQKIKVANSQDWFGSEYYELVESEKKLEVVRQPVKQTVKQPKVESEKKLEAELKPQEYYQRIIANAYQKNLINKSEDYIQKLLVKVRDAELKARTEGVSGTTNMYRQGTIINNLYHAINHVAEILAEKKVKGFNKNTGLDLSKPEPKPLPKINWIYGDEIDIETQSENIPAKFAVTELDNIIPSSDPFSFAWNTEYPKTCQTRNYLTKSEQAKVQQFSSHFKVSHVINDAPVATTGTPIVMRDGVVLGGNGRTMVLFRVEESGDYQKEYVEYLLKKASSFGFEPGQIKQFKKPVLVRLVTIDVSLCGKYSNILNADLRQESDKVTEGIGLSKNLTEKDYENIAAVFDASGDMTFIEVLNDRKYSKSIENILRKSGLITQQNYVQWIDPDTFEFTSDGKSKLESILLGSIMPSRDLITKAKTFTNKLIKALSSLIQVKSLKSNWNFLPSVHEAIQYEFDRRKKKLTLNQYLNQTDAFREPISKRTEMIWKALEQLSQLKFKEFVESYVKTAKNESSSSMFGGEQAKPVDVIEAMANKRGLSDKYKKYEKDGKLKRNYYYVVHNGKIYIACSFAGIYDVDKNKDKEYLKLVNSDEVVEKPTKEIFKTQNDVFNYVNKQKSMFADKKANKQFQNKLGDKMNEVKDYLPLIRASSRTFKGLDKSDKAGFKKTTAYLRKMKDKKIRGGHFFEKKLKAIKDDNSHSDFTRKRAIADLLTDSIVRNESTLKDDVPATIEQTAGLEKPACDCNTKPDVTVPEEKATIADGEIKLNLNNINAAMKSDKFWMDENSKEAKIIRQAAKEGYVRRNSHTQVEWVSKEARDRLAKETANMGDKKKPKRKYTKRKKATMDDGNIFSAIKKAWNKDPIVKWLKK